MAVLSWRDRVALIAAVVAPLAVAAALVPFRDSVPNAGAALVLVVVVVAVAANGHRVAGVVAAASAAVWFDFFLTTPYERFTITHRADIETTVLLLLVGAAVTELAVRGRRQRRLVVTDAVYLAAIGSTAELVASQANPRAVIDQVSVQLISLLGLRGCRFERGRTGGLPRLESDGQVRIEGGSWNLDEYGMPSAGVEIVASNKGSNYGRFVLAPVPGTLASLAARQVAVILVNQVGAALASQSRILQ
jgi:Domain of unknown function (DUF4118)